MVWWRKVQRNNEPVRRGGLKEVRSPPSPFSTGWKRLLVAHRTDNRPTAFTSFDRLKDERLSLSAQRRHGLDLVHPHLTCLSTPDVSTCRPAIIRREWIQGVRASRPSPLDQWPVDHRCLLTNGEHIPALDSRARHMKRSVQALYSATVWILTVKVQSLVKWGGQH